MPTDDRDQQFQRALARHLPNASPDSTCPDTEILAAYQERTLPPNEMENWKLHIADCARCQEILELVEQTETVPVEVPEHYKELQPFQELAAPVGAFRDRANLQQNQGISPTPMVGAAASVQLKPLRSRPAPRWLVPIGAVAAAVIVLMSVREIRLQRAQQIHNAQVQVAENRSSLPQPSSPPSAALDRSRKDEQFAARTESKTQATKVPAPPFVAPRQSAEALPLPASPPTPPSALPPAKGKDVSPPAAAQSTPSASGYFAKTLPQQSARSAHSGAAAGQAPAPAEGKKSENELARPPASNQTVQVQASNAALDSSSATLSSRQRDSAALLKLATSNPHLIVAPGEKYVWLLGGAGRIERSTDRGKSWQPQNSGVTVDLTAGSATSDQVCWVVGKSGTLLLTSDGGTHWKLLASPITADLGGIHAVDASHASIWDVPNRNSFETSDGGATWQRTANE